jgi:hypothetical protein
MSGDVYQKDYLYLKLGKFCVFLNLGTINAWGIDLYLCETRMCFRYVLKKWSFITVIPERLTREV